MRGCGGDVAAGVALVVIAAAYGGPEVLSVADEPVSGPGPGEARIEVRAAGVNPVDVKSYSGAFGADPARLPIRLGAEAAGVVTAVGPDTVGPAGPVDVGDEVIAYRAPGAYASDLVVPAQAVIPKPGTLDWPQAAGLMLTGVTAWHLLAATDVGPGDTVLVHGGSGGVGLMAVQLAVIRGAKVVATASPARRRDGDPVRQARAVGHRDSAEVLQQFMPGGIDAALDLVGTDEAWDVSMGAVSGKARFATIVAFGRGLQAGIKVLGGAPGADPGTEIRERARLELARLAQDGKLRVLVSQTFPLAEAAAAHHAILDGHTTGKIALIP
jgi:NADPH:quinone reductase-like Zn-dependent oxidoreductase